MILADNNFDRKLFKLAVAFLLLCMTFRHAMLYLDFGRINTEMGFDQSLFGVFLIPVTASFGCIFFWERSRISLPRGRWLIRRREAPDEIKSRSQRPSLP